MKTNTQMILMAGLPKSGKTTAIKLLDTQFITRNISQSRVIISTDEIRKKIFGHQYFAPVEGMVWTFAEGMAEILLPQGVDLIIDALNILPFTRAKWIKIAKKYDVYVDCVWMTTSENECLRRNPKSDEPIPNIEILKRIDYATPPSNLEGIRNIYYCDGTTITYQEEKMNYES